MKFVVRCQCGRRLSVDPGAAGSCLDCSCGSQVFVPSLAELKAQAGLLPYNVLAAREASSIIDLPSLCDVCGVEAPTRYAVFYQNIGLIFVRLCSNVEGRLCKPCIHRHFWIFTVTTFLVGWWGLISLFVTPCIIVNNLVRYVICLPMRRPPPDATPPSLTPLVVEKIRPYLDEIMTRLQHGEDALKVAEDVAVLANVTPGQLVLFMRSQV